MAMFPIRWSSPECPSTWVNRRRYISGSLSDALCVENSSEVLDPPVSAPSSVAAEQASTKQSTSGELNVIFSFFILSLPF